MNSINLNDYILKDKTDTNKGYIYLHNLRNDSSLFDIIKKLRNKYKDKTFIISQDINISNENIDKEINLSNCIFENKISFENCIFNNGVCFTNSIFKNDVCFKKCFFIDNPFFNYSFENVIFEGEDIDFSNSDFYNVNFSKTIFGKSKKTHISFEGAKLSNTFFEKAEFKGKILFNKSEIENGRITEIQNTKFNEAIFFDQANFQDVIFLGSISFEKTQFKGDTFFIKTNFYNDNQNLEKEVIQVNFKYALFRKKVHFTKSKFGIKKNGSKEDNYDIEILFKNTKFQKGADFYKAIFYCPIYFSNAEFCVNEKTYSKYIINFEKAQFKKKVNFHYSEFYNTVRFENTKFENLADFYNAHFYRAQQFHLTDFLDRAIFSNTEFHEEVQFLHCKVDNSYVRFESAIFKKGLDISRSNFNDKVNFWNIEIEESGEQYIFNNLENVKYANDFEVQDKTPNIYKQLRETYRIIKDNFYRQNNKIEGSEFYIKEMSVYQREQFKKLGYNKLERLKKLITEKRISDFYPKMRNSSKDFTIKKLIIIFLGIIYLLFYIKTICETKGDPFILTLLLTPILLFCLFYLKDIILLLFNRFSNYFGTDWVRGVVFTMMTGGLVSFFLLCRNYSLWHIDIYDINAWIQSIGFLIRIINVIDMKPFEENGNSLVKLVENNDTNNIILFIGRIFVAYGVYQTVQAFRKFGKS